MWRPRSWAEVLALKGQAEETSRLDFKRELTSKNAEIAKDIAALTVNGGVLIYGVDENKATRVASGIRPLSLSGVEERLHQAAGSRIMPTPDFEVQSVPDPADATNGVVVVVAPASPLAPHQCEGRYPVRRGTTTEYLTEPEVERLYRQRQRLSGPPPSVEDLLSEFRVPPYLPVSPGGDVGSLSIVARPAAEEVTHPAGAWQQAALASAVSAAAQRQATRFANSSQVLSWDRLSSWWPLGAEGWLANLTGGPAHRPQLQGEHFAATLTYPARLSFVAQWELGDPKWAHEVDVARELIAMLAVAGEYFSEVDGAGQTLVATSLRGFEGGVSQLGVEGGAVGMGIPLPHAASDRVDADARTSAIDLRDEPERVARTLIERWLPAFYVDPLSPPDEPRDLFELLVPGARQS